MFVFVPFFFESYKNPYCHVSPLFNGKARASNRQFPGPVGVGRLFFGWLHAGV